MRDCLMKYSLDSCSFSECSQCQIPLQDTPPPFTPCEMHTTLLAYCGRGGLSAHLPPPLPPFKIEMRGTLPFGFAGGHPSPPPPPPPMSGPPRLPWLSSRRGQAGRLRPPVGRRTSHRPRMQPQQCTRLSWWRGRCCRGWGCAWHLQGRPAGATVLRCVSSVWAVHRGPTVGSGCPLPVKGGKIVL